MSVGLFLKRPEIPALWVPQFSRTFSKPLLRQGEARIERERLPEGGDGTLMSD